MFAQEIKKHIGDMNARVHGSNHHQRQASQPATTNKSNTVKIASVPLASNGKAAVVGSSAGAENRENTGRAGPDINELMARQA